MAKKAKYDKNTLLGLMVPKTINDAMISLAQDIIGGIGFVLLMQHKGGSRYNGGNFSIVPRMSLPCYGELRKYKSTHGDECTQPSVGRPGDLCYPFPDGFPRSLAVPLIFRKDFEGEILEAKKEFDEFFFSDRSPWRKGLGGKNNIEFFSHKGSSNKMMGIVLKRLNIDPTVLVSALKIYKHFMVPHHFSKVFLFYRWKTLKEEYGLDEYQAMLMILMNGFISPQDMNSPLVGVDGGYTFATPVSVKRFVNGDPVDLSKGTLEDRFDYDRPNMAKYFQDKEGISFSQFSKINEHDFYTDVQNNNGINSCKINMEKFAKVFIEMFNNDFNRVSEIPTEQPAINAA